MASKKKNKPTRAGLSAALRAQKWQAFSAVTTSLIKYATYAFLGYCTWQSVESLAGKITVADIGLKLLGEVKLSEALSWLGCAGGIAYGAVQGRLRKRNIERMSNGIQSREAAIDPQRSTSGLTKDGQTNPGDTP